MDYCHPCGRHLNGALACPGCGASAEAPVASSVEPSVESTRAYAPGVDVRSQTDGASGEERDAHGDAYGDPHSDAHGDPRGEDDEGGGEREGRAARRKNRGRGRARGDSGGH
ncbi:SCO2400 family protein, partial [Streptomyces sp. W16]|uniref:SCO2400 family protein n=1 Tax=Streptomyces sp. W16 TaxID=3076631 RepID=UPI003FA377EE